MKLIRLLQIQPPFDVRRYLNIGIGRSPELESNSVGRYSDSSVATIERTSSSSNESISRVDTP